MNSGYPDYYEEAILKCKNTIDLSNFKNRAPRITPALPFNEVNLIDEELRTKSKKVFNEKLRYELELTMENMGCTDRSDALMRQLDDLTNPEKVLGKNSNEF